MLKLLKRRMAATSMIIGAALILPGMAVAATRYSVKTIGDMLLQLHDNKTDPTVSGADVGTSNAYEFVVHGKNVISMNIPSTTALRNNPELERRTLPRPVRQAGWTGDGLLCQRQEVQFRSGARQCPFSHPSTGFSERHA